MTFDQMQCRPLARLELMSAISQGILETHQTPQIRVTKIFCPLTSRRHLLWQLQGLHSEFLPQELYLGLYIQLFNLGLITTALTFLMEIVCVLRSAQFHP